MVPQFSAPTGSWDEPVGHKLNFVANQVSAIEAEQRLHTGRPLPDATRFLLDRIFNAPEHISELASITFEQFQGVKASLTEYAVSQALSLPFAPNPALSIPILLRELHANTAKSDLVSLVDDMRHESATLYGLRRGRALDIRRNANIYCLRLPAILMAIMNQSDSPIDALRTAADMSSEAKSFRQWSANMEALVDPNTYLQRLDAARASLARLGRAICAEEGAELTVAAGPVGSNLPSPTVAKLVNYLNVDARFFLPRRFLLNVLSQARQISSVDERLGKILGVDKQLAVDAAEIFLQSSAAILELGAARARTNAQ